MSEKANPSFKGPRLKSNTFPARECQLQSAGNVCNQPMAGLRFDEVLNLKLSVGHSCERPLWSRQTNSR